MSILDKIKDYHFEIKHLIILFIILTLFQTILSYIHSTSTSKLRTKTLELYRQNSAEQLANLTATSLELLLEHGLTNFQNKKENAQNIIRQFDIVLNQQALQQNIDDIFVLVEVRNEIFAIDNGADLYSIFFEKKYPSINQKISYAPVIGRYSDVKEKLIRSEEIHSALEGENTFHVFVPFVPRGEYSGALYMQITPDFTYITREISDIYSESGALFSALILLGLLAMFFITSYTVKERDRAQRQLFKERERQIKRQIEHQKEALFTRRIYHTHHKAEKIMGFIKEDLRSSTRENFKSMRQKITKYANFISRAIYDMKSYDPPIHVIRNPIFKTNLNEVIQFVTDNIFRRVYNEGDSFNLNLELDKNLPVVPVNEYVVWEIVEPIIQNSIDHNGDREVMITIRTVYNPQKCISTIVIEDNGVGLAGDLLSTTENGVKAIFSEHASTKANPQYSGYGCYIAYEISRKCGWKLDAENGEKEGCRFIITIPHNDYSSMV